MSQRPFITSKTFYHFITCYYNLARRECLPQLHPTKDIQDLICKLNPSYILSQF